MRREKRDLAGFEAVVSEDNNVNINANENVNEDINEDNNVNAEADVNMDEDDNLSSDDILNQLLTPKKKKGDTHEMRGIYFEKDVVRVMDKLATKQPKGFKSALVNEAVKKVLKEKGFME